jgi:hypothetical protein
MGSLKSEMDLRLERHLGRHPQPNTAPYQSEPHHEVVFLGAVESLHGLAEETGMDKERGDACNGVVLRRENRKWFVLV